MKLQIVPVMALAGGVASIGGLAWAYGKPAPVLDREEVNAYHNAILFNRLVFLGAGVSVAAFILWAKGIK